MTHLMTNLMSVTSARPFLRARGPAPCAFVRSAVTSDTPADDRDRIENKSLRVVSLQELIAVLSTEFINVPIDETDEAISAALARIGPNVDVDRAYVFLIDGDSMMNTSEWCAPGVKSRRDDLQSVPVSAYPQFMARILESRSVLIPRVEDLPEGQPDRALLLLQNIGSLLAVPILSRRRVIGFVGYDVLGRAKQWTEEATTFLEIVGSIFGNAIERRNADHALRAEKDFFSNVFETAAGLVIVLSPDGRCLRVNRAFRELTGRTAEELADTGWKETVPEESREGARQALRTALSGTSAQFEGLLLSGDRETRTILWNGAVIRSGDGHPEYIIVTGVDLTETLHLREQVEQSRRLDSLGRVAATIAHEFNNVLMAIQPSADLIRRHPDHQKEVERAAERIERAVKRGVTITTEVTRYARRADPARRTISVASWIDTLVDEMRDVLQQRCGEGVVLETRPIDPQLTLQADIDQLDQVFSNLILNAADAIPIGGTITLSVDEVTEHERLQETPDGTPWLHLQVSDTGVGISPSVLDRIFEPLFTTKKKGTGLGLAVAHQIIKSHGGHLCVETTVGSGTTFHVFLRSGHHTGHDICIPTHKETRK